MPAGSTRSASLRRARRTSAIDAPEAPGELGQRGLAHGGQAGAQGGHQLFGDLPRRPLPGPTGKGSAIPSTCRICPQLRTEGWRLPRSINESRATET
jgi:hypothetical protein